MLSKILFTVCLYLVFFGQLKVDSRTKGTELEIKANVVGSSQLPQLVWSGFLTGKDRKFENEREKV